MNEKQTVAYEELVRRYSQIFGMKGLSDEGFNCQIHRSRYEVGVMYGLSYDELCDVDEQAFFDVADVTFSL